MAQQTADGVLQSEEVGSASIHLQKLATDGGRNHSVTNVQAGSARNLEGGRLVLLLICLCLGSFLVGYDSSCIGTLAPVITDQLHALNDLGWFQPVYLVALCAPMLILGQLYSLYSMKTLYMAAFSIFVIGSVLTAAAPSPTSFILGRALSGLGAAGINSGITCNIIANTVPLERRPMILGICGGLECAALAFGPLISGTIANYTTWRVSFYILIPLGVAVIITVFFSISHLRHPEKAHLNRKERLEHIDWIGLATELPLTACLVLGLQWARTLYPWANWRIILLLTLTGALLGIFFFAEYKAGDRSLISLKMLRQRTVAFARLTTFCNFAAMGHFLPLYFQAVRGASTLASGLMYLPMALSMSIFALLGGPITTYIGYYSPTLATSSVLTVIGTGLITTLRPDSPAAKWISYQIIYGIGIGLAFQPPFIAVQTVLGNSTVPTALVLLNFVQILGGIIVLSIAQNVFLTKLASNLSTVVPQFNMTSILTSGALNLVDSVPADHRDLVLIAYNKALVDVFYIALGLSGLTVLSTLGIEFKRIKAKKRE
ncbi:putative efflux pump antibiotic resistance protein [Xylogone sp. PMI_703]|nr:putative efflux pump antibiotic resistance protein [Xylogone sp. PMI_703]